MAVSEFTGRIIAIIHRNDDVEGKWVASYENVVFILEEIKSAVEFLKIYFQSEIRMLWNKYLTNIFLSNHQTTIALQYNNISFQFHSYIRQVFHDNV